MVAPIEERKKLQNLSRRSERVVFAIVLEDSVRIAAKQRAAAFMRISLGAMRANLLRKMSADPECCLLRHNYSSSQKRSFKYFAAESAKTVTMTALACFGIPAAT